MSEIKFLINERVLVLLDYEKQQADFDDNDDNVVVHERTWVSGKVRKFDQVVEEIRETMTFEVEVMIDLYCCNSLNLDPSTWRIVSISYCNDKECMARIRKLSNENVISLVDIKKVFRKSINIMNVSEIEYSKYVELSISIGNLYSLDWLYNMHMSYPQKFKFDMNEVLLSAAKMNHIIIIFWVKNHHNPNQLLNWHELFGITNNNNRNIFQIALIMEGHSEFVNDLIDGYDVFNEEREVNKLIYYIIRALTRNVDLEENSCIHLAAINGKIVFMMNLLYYLFDRIFQYNGCCFYSSQLVSQDKALMTIEYFIDSSKNINGQTVSDIVFNTCDDETIDNYKSLSQSFVHLMTTRATVLQRAKLFRSDYYYSKLIPYSSEFDLTDLDYDNIISDVLIDKSLSFEDYFNNNILPLISHVWKGFDYLFHYSIVLGHWNKVKLLLNLNLVDQSFINEPFYHNGRTAIENACYGSWWMISDKKSDSYISFVNETEINALFNEWDDGIIECSNREMFSETIISEEMSLWDILDFQNANSNKSSTNYSNDSYSNSYIDKWAYYKDIKPRGNINIFMGLLSLTNCNYPTCEFVIDYCDKYMAEFYIRQRIAIRDILMDVFGDLHEPISSYLFVDYKECSESIMKKVLNAPIVGNKEKCLYLTYILLNEFRVDPYLRKIRDNNNNKSESILHLSIHSQHYLCVKYIIKKYKFLLDVESLSDGMLPINYAIAVAKTEERFSTLIASHIISVRSEMIRSKNGDEVYAGMGYDSKLYCRRVKQILLRVTDSSGRSTKDFVNNNNDYFELKIEASLSLFDTIYNHLIIMVKNVESLVAIEEYCDLKGGRLSLEYFNKEFMDSNDKFGTIQEQKFLFVCLSMGRLDVIEWYCKDMVSDDIHYSDDRSISKVTLWRFNSYDVNQLNGRGIFHEHRNMLNFWFTDPQAKESFYKQISAKDVSIFYNQLELFAVINELEIEYEEEEAIKDFIYRNQELAKFEGPTSFHADTTNLLARSGFRPAILNGLSIESIEFELTKGNDIANEFRSKLKLAISISSFDNMRNESHLFVLKRVRLFEREISDNIIKYCMAQNYVHIIKWIIEMIPQDYEERDDILSNCMIDAISCGRIDFVSYLRNNMGMSIHDKPSVEKYSSYIMVAACHLEFDMFRLFYEETPSSDRPSMDSILIGMIEDVQDYFPQQHRLFGYRPAINETSAEHLRNKSNNRLRFFEYFVSIGLLTSNSNCKIVESVILSFTGYRSESYTSENIFKVPIINFDLIYYLVEIIGLDITKFQTCFCNCPNQMVTDLVGKKKNEARIINSIRNGDDINKLEKIEIESGINITNITTRDGIPILHLAISFQQLHIVEWLLLSKSELKVNELDKLGRTAISIARDLQLYSLVSLLEKYK